MMNNGFGAADCSCPWRLSETPCHEHSHQRIPRADASWLCVGHEHVITTAGEVTSAGIVLAPLPVEQP